MSDDPVENVVDDSDPREESAAWAYGELAGGRLAEDVAADLVANGWSEEDAAEIAEGARRQTRGRRGVVTREDAARAADARYRDSMGKNPLVGGRGMFGMLGSFVRSILSFRAAKPDRLGPRKYTRPPGDGDGHSK